MAWWQYAFAVVLFFLGRAVASFSIIIPQICVNFGIPFAKKIEDKTGISTLIVRKKYRKTILLWFAINTIALVFLLRYVPRLYATSYAIGNALIVFSIGKTRKSPDNIQEFIETNKALFSPENYERIEKYLQENGYINYENSESSLLIKNAHGGSVKNSSVDIYDAEDKKYIKTLIDASHDTLGENDAKRIIDVLRCYSQKGKTSALLLFDRIANDIIENTSPESEAQSLMKLSFMAGALYPNGVVSKDESNRLSKKYGDILQEHIISNAGKQ